MFVETSQDAGTNLPGAHGRDVSQSPSHLHRRQRAARAFLGEVSSRTAPAVVDRSAVGDAPTVCTRLVRGGVLGRLYGIAVEGIQDDTLERLDRMRPSAIEIKAIEAALDERWSRRGVRF